MSSEARTSGDAAEIGVRNRSEHSRRIHRIDPDADDLEPACSRKHEQDTDWKRCDIERLTAFNRWDRCQNPECFGNDPNADDEEQELIADGGRSAEHHLDEAADQLETAYEKEDGWDKDAIGELRKDLAGLQGFEVPSEVATDGGQREIVLRGFDPENADRIESLLAESLRLENVAIRRNSR